MNELKTAWRNLLRGGFYSAVNIFGLTIGLTACFVVTTVIVRRTIARMAMMIGVLLLNTSSFAQADTISKTGYMFFKPMENRKPVQAIFFEKKVIDNLSAAVFNVQFNLQEDTGILVAMEFLDTSAAQRAVFGRALDIKLWSIISINENGIVNTYRHDMKVMPVTLKIFSLLGSYSEIALDSFSIPVWSDKGLVIENCRYQTQEFGLIKNIYRLAEKD